MSKGSLTSMGLFYTNLTIYQPDRASLLAELRRLDRTAFISPTIRGHTIVFDKIIDGQDSDAIEKLGRAVTKALQCSALAGLLHDDDVLYLWLFKDGEVRDRYCSCPSYFNFNADAEHEPPAGGNAKLICEAFDRAGHEERAEQLLRVDLLKDELPNVLGELERHAALAAELGMPGFVAGVC